MMGTAKAKPKFKVGDRVRCLSACVGQFTAGKVYTVRELNTFSLGVVADDSGVENGWGYSLFEPATLTIETGRYYKTRDGRKVGPMEVYMHGSWLDGSWHADRAERPLNLGYWNNDGTAKFVGITVFPDLIAEWVEPQVEQGPGAIVAVIENGQPKPANCPIVHTNREEAKVEAKRLATKHLGQEFGVFELVGTCKDERQFDHEWQRLAVNGEKISAIKEIRRLTGFGLKSSKDGLEDWLSRNAA